MTAGRRAAGALSPREGVGVSAASKMRRALRGILFTLLRRRSGLRVKKRTRVGGRQSVRVITLPSASSAASNQPRASMDDRDGGGGDDDDESVSGADSDSSDVVFVDETPARATSRGGSSRSRTGSDLVRAAAHALGLRSKSERGMGNCMFCAVSSGINTWLASKRGSAGKAADAALFGEDAKRKDTRVVTWAHVRAALARHLRAIARDAPKVAGVRNERGPFISPHEEIRVKKRCTRAKELVMETLMEGDQGRAWLTKKNGALSNERASVAERFDAYVQSMATDASAFVSHRTWRRYWGADNELVVLASKLRVAMVCVEAATENGGVFLAVPPDVAEVGEKKNEKTKNNLSRFGRYVCDGAFETYDRSSSSSSDDCLRWRASRGAVTLTVRLARADSKAARRAVAGDGASRILPALAVVHRPGHFDSLQPEEGYVLVMEREKKARGE